MCPRKDKTPYQWETLYKTLLEKQEPEKNDYQLLTDELLTKAFAELKEDYSDAPTKQKVLAQNMEKTFYHAQAEIAKHYYLTLSSQVENIQSDQLLLKEAVDSANRKKEGHLKTLSDAKIKIAQNEQMISQKKGQLSSVALITDESHDSTPAPPPPPPLLLLKAGKPLKMAAPKQGASKLASKKELPEKKDLAGKLADELKKDKPNLKHIDPETLRKEKDAPVSLPTIRPSRKGPRQEAPTPEDLFSIIDSITDNPEPQPKRTPEQSAELKAMLRKIEAKEKELIREKKTLAEMGNLVLLYGENTSREARALQEETQLVITQSQALIEKQQAKLKQIDELLALQKEIREAQNQLNQPAAVTVDLPSESPKENVESSVPTNECVTVAPPPPPPPPLPSIGKRVTRSKQPAIQTEKTQTPPTVKSDKKAPKVETLAGLAKLFDDPKFQERRKKMEQEERKAEIANSQTDKQSLKAAADDKESKQTSQREKVAAFLVKNKEELKLSDDPEIHFLWRQQKESLDKESAKLESISIPNIDELSKLHSTLLKTKSEKARKTI